MGNLRHSLKQLYFLLFSMFANFPYRSHPSLSMLCFRILQSLRLYTSPIFSGQLRKALDSKMMEKYQERLQDESIKLAELPDLVKYVSHS